MVVEYWKDNIWYKKCPLRKNDVGKVVLKVAQNNGRQSRLTNHSDFKTCISRLLDLDIPVIYVAQLSAWLPKHENSRFMLISILSKSVENFVNNKLLSKCSINQRQLGFPWACSFCRYLLGKTNSKPSQKKVVSRANSLVYTAISMSSGVRQKVNVMWAQHEHRCQHFLLVF